MSVTIATLSFISGQINIFVGISLFIIGVIGGLLTIIVFISLKTFRQSPCALYLIVMSFVNIGQLLTGLLSRFTTSATGIDWTQLSLFYCKFRNYLLIVFTDTSMICMCLATIDQYLATCHYPRWQQWSNLKLARRLSIISIIFGFSIGIPHLIYFIQIVSPTTGKTICVTINGPFTQINIYFYRLFISNILPLSITLIFGLLTYRNISQIAYRTVPLVRRELDKQLTIMILVQDIFTFLTLLPPTTTGILGLKFGTTLDPLSDAIFQLATIISYMFYYLYFSGPFYIYLCVSERFRRQLKYVLCDIHLNRWRQPRLVVNQVTPQT